MGQVISYPEAGAEQKKTAFIGMIIFVASWTMMFACLFFIYLALRATSKAWPPLGLPLLPLAVPGLNTVIIVLSSVVLEGGIRWLRQGHKSRLAPSLGVASALGVLFLAIQYAVGLDLHAHGLRVDGGGYAAVFYAMAIIHGAHVAVGIAALWVLLVRSLRGAYSAPRHLGVRLWAIYWHFVGIIWILIYGLVFVL